MTAHKPDMVTRQRADGRYVCTCLTCMDTSRPSFHKPAVDDWRRLHIKAALSGEGK